jgi:hypothetical protein
VSGQDSVARIGRRSILVAVLVLAAVVVWGIGSWFATLTRNTAPRPLASPSPTASPSSSASLAPPLSTVLDLSGTGDEESESFTVSRGWQITWQTDGPRFAFAVRGDEDLGTIVDQTGTSSGANSLPTAGTFYIEVTAKGPWSLKVLQGEAPTRSPS